MRKRLFEIIEASRGEDRASSAYDAFMILVIVLSLVPLAFKGEHPALAVLDKVCACIFALDYLARLATADFKYGGSSALSFVRYPFSFMALVDLLSILPSFTAINNSFKVLRLMRMFRALRILRVFKFARYSRSVQIIGRVFRRSKDALLAVGSFALVYVLVSALVILNLEPDSFDSFFEAVYWATVSLTTMRVFTMLSAAFGIAIGALPSGIITAGYMAELSKEQKAEEEERVPALQPTAVRGLWQEGEDR